MTVSSLTGKKTYLPKAPNGWFKSAQRRIALALGGNPGPKDLADRKFINTVKKAGEKAEAGMNKVQSELQDWKAAEKRYNDIVAYITAIIENQTVGLDDVLASQKQIADLQAAVEKLIGTLKDNDAEGFAKLQEIKQNLTALRKNQKNLEDALTKKASPDASRPEETTPETPSE